MEELKKQINILIDKYEKQKLNYMLHGQTGEVRECEGMLQAFKFVRLLINTNYNLS